MTVVRLFPVAAEMHLEVMAMIVHAPADELLEEVAYLRLLAAASRTGFLARLELVRVAAAHADPSAGVCGAATSATVSMVRRRTERVSNPVVQSQSMGC